MAAQPRNRQFWGKARPKNAAHDTKNRQPDAKNRQSWATAWPMKPHHMSPAKWQPDLETGRLGPEPGPKTQRMMRKFGRPTQKPASLGRVRPNSPGTVTARTGSPTPNLGKQMPNNQGELATTTGSPSRRCEQNRQLNPKTGRFGPELRKKTTHYRKNWQPNPKTGSLGQS